MIDQGVATAWLRTGGNLKKGAVNPFTLPDDSPRFKPPDKPLEKPSTEKSIQTGKNTPSAEKKKQSSLPEEQAPAQGKVTKPQEKNTQPKILVFPEQTKKNYNLPAKDVRLQQLQEQLKAYHRQLDPKSIIQEFKETHLISPTDGTLLGVVRQELCKANGEISAQLSKLAGKMAKQSKDLEMGGEMLQFLQSLDGLNITPDMAKLWQNTQVKQAQQRVEALQKQIQQAKTQHNQSTAGRQGGSTENVLNHGGGLSLMLLEQELEQAQAVLAMRNQQVQVIQQLANAPPEQRQQILADLVHRQELQNQTLRRDLDAMHQDQTRLQQQANQYNQLLAMVQAGQRIEDPALQALMGPILQQTVGSYQQLFTNPQEIEQNIQQVEQLIQDVNAGQISKTVLDPKQPKHKWPQNTMVVAPTHQESLAWGDYFIKDFFQALGKSGSAPEALQKLTEGGLIIDNYPIDGYPSKHYEVPVMGKNQVKCWQKNENHPRYVLIIQGANSPGEDPNRFQNDMNDFMKQMQDQYGPNVQFITCNGQNLQEIQQAFEKLHKVGGNDAELMVVIRAHGTTMGLEPGVKPKQGVLQGSQVGAVNLGGDVMLTDTQLKEWMQQVSHFHGVLVLPITCHGGSWVAQGLPPPQQPPTDTT